MMLTYLLLSNQLFQLSSLVVLYKFLDDIKGHHEFDSPMSSGLTRLSLEEVLNIDVFKHVKFFVLNHSVKKCPKSIVRIFNIKTTYAQLSSIHTLIS
jgi:hypothetical protein